MEGRKEDTGKLPLDLLDPYALSQIARILQFGANKYNANNWRGGIIWSRLYGATLRHLFAWWDGEDLDPETGISHLAHAACELMFLLNFERDFRDGDDRYRKEVNDSDTHR